MSRTVSLVQRVEIASPCPVSWESMTGNDQVRFCGQCQLNVFNLSEMTALEGERLIIEKEGKLCARIYRRRDGTVLTRDCPVGLAAVRRRLVGFGVAVAASVMFVAGAAMSCIFGHRDDEWYGLSAYAQASAKLRQWMNVPLNCGGWRGGIVIINTPHKIPIIDPILADRFEPGSPLPPASPQSTGFSFPLSDPGSPFPTSR